MNADPRALVDEVLLVNYPPEQRDEIRRQLRTLLANQCVEGPLGGPVLSSFDGELVGHVADLEFSLYADGELYAHHEHTHEDALIGRVDPSNPDAVEEARSA